MHESSEKCLQNMVRRPKGKRLLGGHIHRWGDNIKVLLKDKMLCGLDVSISA
jgi:hypothetical protein